MIEAALIENIIARHADAIRRDAAAILSVVAWADVPAGVSVLPLVRRPDALGISIGSGHALALANGCRPGMVAVMADIDETIRSALRASPDDAALGLMAARPMAEALAVHELAHAITSRPDGTGTVAEAAALVAAADSRPLRTGADVHGPTWAAAVVILTRRVNALRPGYEMRAREAAMQDHLYRYGLDAAAVAAAVGIVPDDARLREVLAPGGDVAGRVAAVCPPEGERQAFIEEYRGQHRAAGDRIEVSRRKAG